MFHGLETIMSIKHIDNIPSKREYYLSLIHVSTINLCWEILKIMQKELFQSDNPELLIIQYVSTDWSECSACAALGRRRWIIANTINGFELQ